MASAVLALAYGAGPSLAAPTPFGACVGADGTDCTAELGHASISITDTLSINEMRAISFGNFATSTPTTSDTVVLNLDGTRTVSGGFLPLHGGDGGGFSGAGTAGGLDTGAQSPGHYTISGATEGGAEIYISFADTSGNIIDMCNSAGDCDSYHPGNAVTLSGGGLTMDSFVINEAGSDVYGHYVINDTSSTQSPGITNPFDPADHTTTLSGAGAADVVVGATLHSDGTALTAGKYTGTFVIMASY